jgi:hypothetical protein
MITKAFKMAAYGLNCLKQVMNSDIPEVQTIKKIGAAIANGTLQGIHMIGEASFPQAISPSPAYSTIKNG